MHLDILNRCFFIHHFFWLGLHIYTESNILKNLSFGDILQKICLRWLKLCLGANKRPNLKINVYAINYLDTCEQLSDKRIKGKQTDNKLTEGICEKPSISGLLAMGWRYKFAASGA